jgi:serine/threonine protein kinase
LAAPASGGTPLPLPLIEGAIDLPDYELVQPPIGEGAYGKVWLARNAVGQWQALKIVYRAKFGEDQSPYEREFRGIESYKRVSDAHPGLLRVDFVSRMKPQGYFYYAMELGDAATPGWELNPANYHPLDLAALCSANHGRLPARECARIGAQLCDALHFLHSQELAHRDIKPRNIIFVNGQPKLADVGLVADVQRPLQDITWVGTPGYMPPPPEPPGTAAADIYALGMVLYVISTGCKPSVFPELSETLVDRKLHPDFNLLCPIIFHACHPDRTKRPTAIEMKEALLQVEMKLRVSSQPASEPL